MLGLSGCFLFSPATILNTMLSSISCCYLVHGAWQPLPAVPGLRWYPHAASISQPRSAATHRCRITSEVLNLELTQRRGQIQGSYVTAVLSCMVLW